MSLLQVTCILLALKLCPSFFYYFTYRKPYYFSSYYFDYRQTLLTLSGHTTLCTPSSAGTVEPHYDEVAFDPKKVLWYSFVKIASLNRFVINIHLLHCNSGETIFNLIWYILQFVIAVFIVSRFDLLLHHRRMPPPCILSIFVAPHIFISFEWCCVCVHVEFVMSDRCTAWCQCHLCCKICFALCASNSWNVVSSDV